MTEEIATEALLDTDARVYDPDPKSTSGISVRVIGYSRTARTVITVIVVPNEDGGWWGANAWPSNGTERRLYAEQEGDEPNG